MLGEQMSDAEFRDTLLRIAERYEALAKKATAVKSTLVSVRGPQAPNGFDAAPEFDVGNFRPITGALSGRNFMAEHPHWHATRIPGAVQGSSPGGLEYRCYLLGCDDKILAFEAAAHCNDDEAIAWAERLFDERPRHSGIELWRGTKLVHRKLAGRGMLE